MTLNILSKDFPPVASGNKTYLGRARPGGGSGGIPSWVPPPGYFADIPATNYPADLAPAIYGGSNSASVVFEDWTGGAILYDWSALGGFTIQGGGHEGTDGETHIQMGFTFDFSTLVWSIGNVPLQANTRGQFTPTGIAPDNSTYNPHTYLSNQEFPALWGGAPRGSVIEVCSAGSPYPQHIRVFDPSQAHGVAVIPTLTGSLGGSTNNEVYYSNNGPGNTNFQTLTVKDEKRGGWWCETNGQHDNMLFVKPALPNFNITRVPAIHGNAEWSLIARSEALDLIFHLNGGRSSNEGVPRTLTVRDCVTGVITQATIAGDLPARVYQLDGWESYPGYQFQFRPEQTGAVWVESLGCIVGIDFTGLDGKAAPARIFKITPTTSNLKTGEWAVTFLTPLPTVTGNALREAKNGTFSKFQYVKTLQAFVIASSHTTKPQVISI